LPGVLSTPAAGFLLPGVADHTLAGVLAGLAGTAIAGVVLYALAALVRARDAGPAPRDARPEPSAGEDLHRHEHGHADAPVHRHPHHHDPRPGHEHAHATGFERHTYVVSPVHDLDPRAKIAAVLVVVLAVVLAPAPRPLEAFAFAAFVLALTGAANLPPLTALARSAIVLPFAGTIALLAPITSVGGSWSAGGIAAAYAGGGWLVAWSILAKAWMSASLLVLLSLTTPAPRLFKGLRALRLPDVILTMLSFTYRFAEVVRAQVRSMRAAVASRAPGLRGWRLVRLLGNLAGNLFVRAYERGERVHAAMLSRGYDGTLPSAEPLHARAADLVAIAVALCVAGALALY
ncbi:MAG: cobalt ECF transporter T component CbiQ, partial [Actinobacteria bacterium]